MFLTKEEEKLLERGDGVSKCMEILVALGEIFGAERLIPIKHAHISGVSYQNIGDEGLEWLKNLNVNFAVKTTINPAGMDLERWSEMGIDESFAKKQIELLNVFKEMGAELTLTCTPYYIQKPSIGEHLAWAESSAVIYANSVLGARTNRESGISALASAVIGKTPYYGLHIKENRAPNILVKVECDCDPAILGYKMGSEIEGIPIFKFNRMLSDDELKALGASLASTGNIAMFHVVEQTPEWNHFDIPREKVSVDKADLKFECNPDLIALGCPHMSKSEILDVYRIVEKMGGKVKTEFWVFTSRYVYDSMKDVVNRLEKRGIKVFKDTCMVVSPATERFECVMTNSGKALTYLPKLRGVTVMYGSLEECVKKAFE
ncbi:aconitase X catalytic domain-containing protein [Archaeoglobus sp.]